MCVPHIIVDWYSCFITDFNYMYQTTKSLSKMQDCAYTVFSSKRIVISLNLIHTFRKSKAIIRIDISFHKFIYKINQQYVSAIFCIDFTVTLLLLTFNTIQLHVNITQNIKTWIVFFIDS